MARDMFKLSYTVRMLSGTTDTAEVMIYGEIIEDTPAWRKWSEQDKSAAELDKAIKEIKAAGATKLLVRINSPGGVCTEGVAMRAVLANAGFEEVSIRIEGLCASAATDIATLGGAKVSICEGSEYMIHNPRCHTSGTANEIEGTLQRLRNIEQMSRGFYTARTGQTEEQVKAWMDAETWFTAEQAVEYGFCDEVLKSDKGKDSPAVACVSSREMEAMRGMYRAIPTQIAQRDETTVSKAAAAATENKNNEEDKNMDARNVTMEQLRAENPDLLKQIQQSAVDAERGRQKDIDALTVPGYEAMAAAAKADGTSAMDFHKQLVKAMQEKGAAFLAQRQKETGPAQNVTGGAAEDGVTDDAKELENFAKAMAGYAGDYRDNTGGMY